MQLNGQRRDYGMGSAYEVSLADPRTAAADLRRRVNDGFEPVAERQYAKCVPMGSDLTGSGNARTFLGEAMRDPDGANLDRIQVVKGWIDDKGKMQERVFDVVWSGNRKLGKDGKLPNVGNTVKGATYRNSIGSPVLSAFWRDPSHRAGERAFYYSRVLEIPTPTWLAYAMVQIDQRALPKDAKLVHQERGYGSPIWVGSK